MNKTTLKNFAINARLELLARVRDRAALYGITEEKVKAHELARSEQFQKLGGDMLTQREIAQRNALISRVSARGFGQAMEEAAYTWFNRFIALRYMQAHNLLPVDVPVLPMTAGELPQIVRQAQNVALEGVDIALVADMLDNNRTEELYKYLLIALCNALSEPLPQMFEAIEDYTELLFPDGILKAESVLGMLAGVEADNWQDIQVIGWLYQYYNTELKQETFDLLKKNVKITKDRIGAATQLFTPEWIVNYMVENSLGRLWLEGHPDANLRGKWRYYMDEAEQPLEVAAQLAEMRKGYADLQPELITVLDPCMGSGHVLVYAFDVLMDIYRSRGYTDRDAVQSIVTNNLYGLDIDDRAAQLAYFAVMMKACEYDRRFLRRGIQPQVYAIPEWDEETRKDWSVELKNLCNLLRDGKEFGSIIDMPAMSWDVMRREVELMADWQGQISLDSVSEGTRQKLRELIDVGQAMAQKYDVVVTNPPYMGASNMSSHTVDYVKEFYSDAKSDLFSVLMDRCNEFCKPHCFYAMITMQSWMFLGSFDNLRRELLQCNTILSLLHLGIKAFEEIGNDIVQTTTFTVRKDRIKSYMGSYFKLLTHDRLEKQRLYLCRENRYLMDQERFFQIPGQPIAYWVSESTFVAFLTLKKLGEVADPRQGIATADNNRFLRLWHEVVWTTIGFGIGDGFTAAQSNYTWFPYQKGGDYRKWYGNNNYVVLWKNNGETIKHYKAAVVRNPEFHLREGLTWTWITTGYFGARFSPKGSVFDVAGSTLFTDNHLMDILAYMCSCVADYLVKIINPTINFSNGVISKLPITLDLPSVVASTAEKNVAISKADWDSFESSWDFQCHPLI